MFIEERDGILLLFLPPMNYEKISDEEKLKALEDFARRTAKLIHYLHSTINELMGQWKKGKDFQECKECGNLRTRK